MLDIPQNIVRRTTSFVWVNVTIIIFAFIVSYMTTVYLVFYY